MKTSLVLRGLLLVAVAAAPGCSLPLADASATLANTCTDTSECPAGSVCVDGFCASTDASLEGLILLVEVPASSATQLGAMTQIFAPEDLGVVVQGSLPSSKQRLDLDISPPVLVTASLELIDPDPLCPTGTPASPDEYHYELDIELQPTGGPSGLPAQPYVGIPDPMLAPEASVSVPPGTYNIHIQPRILPELPPVNPPQEAVAVHSTCELPPIIFRDQAVGGTELPIAISAEMPGTYSGEVLHFPVPGWTIDLVENKRGIVVSTTKVFPNEVATDSTPFSVKVWAENTDPEIVDPVLRLLPPQDGGEPWMPLAFWKHAALPAYALLDLAVLNEAEVIYGEDGLGVRGQVLRALDGTGVPSRVAIQSDELLDGDLGQNLVFTATVDTDDEGNFAIPLLTGDYKLTALPDDDALAVSSTTITLSSGSLGGGFDIEVYPKRNLTGTATLENGTAAHDVPVLLAPATPTPKSFVESLVDVAVLAPTGGAATTDAGGTFTVRVDPGIYDLVLQPTADTGLPWTVVPRLTIADTREDAPTIAARIPSPVVLFGTVRAPDGTPIDGARIRAFIAPPPSPDAEDGEIPPVIQIGEAESAGDGSYRLLLPPSISPS